MPPRNRPADAPATPPAPPAARAREDGLLPAHFAFVRARVQGVALREAWLRYLQPPGELQPPDAATMQAVLRRIRDAFAAAARRERRHGLARLVLVDLERIPEAPPRPSLAEFAAERGLEDFSEAEQLEAYQAAFGRADPRPGRRARLVARQLEALRWLEALGPRTPRLDDGVDAWLPPPLARRLVDAGWTTLRRLVDQVNGRSGRWWRPLAGIGPTKAVRIEAWLRAHAASLGVTVAPRWSAQPMAVAAPASAPAGRAAAAGPPPAFAARLRRAPVEARLGSEAERAVVDAWLAAKPRASAHTRRAYRREAERFQLWARLARGRTLAEVGADDAAAYLGFLADPQPRADWCAERHHPRWSPLWRPFEGPLSAAARRQAVAILRNLYAFLETAEGRQAPNPWHGPAAGCLRRAPIDAGRHLTPLQCAAIEARLARLPDSAANWRLRLAWALVDATGLRVAELLQLRGADWLPARPGQGAALLRVGAGARERLLALPDALGPLLARSLAARALPADPADPALREVRLIGQAAEWSRGARGLAAGRRLDPRAGIAPGTLYTAFKALFGQAAQDLAARGEADAAAALRRASGHWLRHTHGVRALGQGVPLETAQHRLGHASRATTRHYAAARG